jgi:3-oxocholest-4-en-26-oate---CoA ligase
MAELTTFNFADIWEAIADRVPEREALAVGTRRLTYAQLEERANRLANWLRGQGVEAGQHIGLYLTNGTEYLEAMLAAFKLRAVPINVNYRYVDSELRYLFDDADVVGVIHDLEFAPRIDAIRHDLPDVRWYLAVGDDYENALTEASPERHAVERSSDDAYVIYTGGTTGMPKGVVWRQQDAFYACIGGGDPMRLAGPVDEPHQMPERIIDGEFVYLPVAPLMHAAGQWTVLSWLFAGGRIVLLPGSLDPSLVWRTVQDEKVNLVTVVGDPVVRPLVDAWEDDGPFDVSSLFSVGSGGAPLTPSLKQRLMEILPGVMVADGFGSSETGAQGTQRVTNTDEITDSARFTLSENTLVVDEETLAPVAAGSGVVGRVALRGRIPQGYYNDPDKTAQTFVEVEGSRWVLTGDMATVEADGTARLLGRGSGCINTGGEKVFPEEVEAVLKKHADVYDVVVVGVPDERWGQRVAAVVQPAPGADPTLDDLAEHCRAELAGYKIPRSLVVVDRVMRSPAGKADFRWALATAQGQ